MYRENNVLKKYTHLLELLQMLKMSSTQKIISMLRETSLEDRSLPDIERQQYILGVVNFIHQAHSDFINVLEEEE